MCGARQAGEWGDGAVRALLRVLAEAEDFSVGLEACLDVLAELSQISAVALFQLDGASGFLNIVSSRGFTDTAVRSARRLPLDSTLTGLAVRDGRVLSSRDVAQDFRILPSIREEMARQKNQMIVSVPLILYRRPVGAMNLVWNEDRALSAVEIESVSALGAGIAVALEHTRRDYLARHDPLTGLLNRSELGQLLDERTAVTARYGNTLSLLLLDIDHFKQLNDRFGHQAGDAVLKALACLLRERLRRSDSIFRYGGDEFICLLPETDSLEAAGIAEDIRACFSRLRHCAGSGEFSATLTLGIAQCHGERSDELLRRADAALYHAKRAGRNRVEVA